MQKILICIPFHDNPGRICYLKMLVARFLNEYRKVFEEVRIIIDTNRLDSLVEEESFQEAIADGRIRVVVHTRLDHPFHLTWCHRAHIKEYLEDFDVFMYVEDDIDLPIKNMVRYLENMELLQEGREVLQEGIKDGVPVFLRVEKKGGVRYNSDAEEIQEIPRSEIRTVGGRRFVTNLGHPLPYHGLWICPRERLREWMPENFVRWETSREMAASFLIWEKKKLHYLELEEDGDGVAETSLCYHLPNNYAYSEGRLGNILLDDVIRILE